MAFLQIILPALVLVLAHCEHLDRDKGPSIIDYKFANNLSENL